MLFMLCEKREVRGETSEGEVKFHTLPLTFVISLFTSLLPPFTFVVSRYSFHKTISSQCFVPGCYSIQVDLPAMDTDNNSPAILTA